MVKEKKKQPYKLKENSVSSVEYPQNTLVNRHVGFFPYQLIFQHQLGVLQFSSDTINLELVLDVTD